MNLIALRSFGSASDNRLLAAGPLHKQPGTCWWRLVLLRYSSSELSVHSECFQDENLAYTIDKLAGGMSNTVSSSLVHGSYFPIKDLTLAVARFGQKLSDGAPDMASLFRSDTAKVEARPPRPDSPDPQQFP